MAHIAVDIGASSGRLVLGEKEKSKLYLKEIHRFTNRFTDKNGTLYWDIDQLLYEILTGLQYVKENGYEQCTIGIDTWAVDYVLIDKEGNKLKEVVSYRDNRTERTIDKITERISKEKIYDKTGIQFMPINTIYQLYEEDNDILKKTDQILMIPDYLNYCLTGKKVMETTNASTTQLLNVNQREIDEKLLEIVGLRRDQFARLIEPGNNLGNIKKEWFQEFSLPECNVISVASHDTASAVIGTPTTVDNWAYLSSGTWSLLGIETNEPIMNNLAFRGNYTNEWGAFYTYRFLKNIMGMWVIQQVRNSLLESYNYDELVQEAKKVKPFQQYVDLNEDRFLNPKNMIEEIQTYCKETNQTIPQSPGELAACVYNNLAIIYAIAIEEMEYITRKEINQLYIVGGGGRNELLNQLTADLSDKIILTGPTEATAIGNIMMQIITEGELNNLVEGRKLIADSVKLTEFQPKAVDRASIINDFKNVTEK